MKHSGGIERVTANLANRWCVSHDINILVSGNEIDSFYPLDSRIDIQGLGIEMYKKNPLSVFIWILSIIVCLYKYLRTNKIDIILGVWTSMAVCSIISGYLQNVKTIACEHIAYDVTKLPLRIMRRIFYPYATSVVTLTIADKIKFERYCRNVFCIPNTVSICASSLPDYNNKRVIAVGRLVRQKGFDLLISSWNRIHKSFPDWELVIIGGNIGADDNSILIHNLIKKFSLQGIVKILPPTKEILDEYLKSSIFVLSSRFEGLPMVMLEAMSIGLATISFDCPTGPKDVIENEVNGILVPMGDIEKLAEGLGRIMDDVKLREELGHAAKTSINVHFNSKNNDMKWEQLFYEITS